jgi:hypothetical protein
MLGLKPGVTDKPVEARLTLPFSQMLGKASFFSSSFVSSSFVFSSLPSSSLFSLN